MTIWGAIVGRPQYYFTDLDALIADAGGHPPERFACPARCGRTIAQVQPCTHATGTTTLTARCPCGATAEIIVLDSEEE